MKRVSKLLSILFVGMMLFADAVPVMADDGTSGADTSKSREAVLQGIEAEGDGTLKKDMPQSEDIYITLADDWRYRWNADGLAVKDSVIHLDDYKGSNCSFRLYRVADKYYGIRYEGSTKCFADIKNKSTVDGGILHLYSPLETELEDNPQRQFAFYFVDTDECGNEYYYIQNKNSGLWMGYEDKNKSGSPDREETICQTSKENRKLWIITRGVVPKEGNEAEDLIACREGSTDKEEGVFVSMFRKDSLDCVTSEGDLALNGTSLHFYRMGTNSKMLLIWNHNHSAYEIRCYTDGENYREAVWDLESEGTISNADVHLWDEQSKSENKNTSQLWRFYRQEDGSYLIKNAKTGKYIGYQYDKDDEGKNLEDSGTLKQLDTGEGTFGDDVRKLAYFTVDRIAGTDNPVNFNYSVD